jgi:hypothetical protein
MKTGCKAVLSSCCLGIGGNAQHVAEHDVIGSLVRCPIHSSLRERSGAVDIAFRKVKPSEPRKRLWMTSTKCERVSEGELGALELALSQQTPAVGKVPLEALAGLIIEGGDRGLERSRIGPLVDLCIAPLRILSRLTHRALRERERVFAMVTQGSAQGRRFHSA